MVARNRFEAGEPVCAAQVHISRLARRRTPFPRPLSNQRTSQETIVTRLEFYPWIYLSIIVSNDGNFLTVFQRIFTIVRRKIINFGNIT